MLIGLIGDEQSWRFALADLKWLTPGSVLKPTDSSQKKESGSHFLLHVLCSYCVLSVFKRASFILHTRKEKSLATVSMIGHTIDDPNHICPIPKSGAQTGSYICQVVPIWGFCSHPRAGILSPWFMPQREIMWKQFGASMELHPFRQTAIHKMPCLKLL